ncbi:hypothetical protein MXB_5317 [Myxobolus squamalis]|nr:hypothetical protein MXB_5317 [Myxobolus squamalis]
MSSLFRSSFVNLKTALSVFEKHFSTTSTAFRQKRSLRYPLWAKYTVRRHNLIKHGRNNRWQKFKDTIDENMTKIDKRLVDIEKFDHIRKNRKLSSMNIFPPILETSTISKPIIIHSLDGSATLCIHRENKIGTSSNMKMYNQHMFESYSDLMHPHYVLVMEIVPPTSHQVQSWKIEKIAISRLSFIDRKRYFSLKEKERYTLAHTLFKHKRIPLMPDFKHTIF